MNACRRWLLIPVLALGTGVTDVGAKSIVKDERPRILLTGDLLLEITGALDPAVPSDCIEPTSSGNSDFPMDMSDYYQNAYDCLMSKAEAYACDPRAEVGDLEDPWSTKQVRVLDAKLLNLALAAKLSGDSVLVAKVANWANELVAIGNANGGSWFGPPADRVSNVNDFAKNSSFKGVFCTYDWFSDDTSANGACTGSPLTPDWTGYAELCYDAASTLHNEPPSSFDDDYYKSPWWTDLMVAFCMTFDGEEQTGDLPNVPLYTIENLMSWYLLLKMDQNEARDAAMMGSYSGYATERPGEDIVTSAMFQSATDAMDPFDPVHYGAEHYLRYHTWLMYWTTAQFKKGGTGDDDALSHGHSYADVEMYAMALKTANEAWTHNYPPGDDHAFTLDFVRRALADNLVPRFTENQKADYEWAVLLFDSSIEATAPGRSHPYGTSSGADLPTARYFGVPSTDPAEIHKSDYTIIRSDFDVCSASPSGNPPMTGTEESMMLSIFAGPGTGGHDNLSEGHFEIRLGENVLTADSGVYDATDTGHYAYYYEHSASTNAPALYRPGVVEFPCGGVDGWPTGYGLVLREGYQVEDTVTPCQPRTFVDWTESFGEHVRSYVEYFEHDSNGLGSTFVRTNLTAVYDPASLAGSGPGLGGEDGYVAREFVYSEGAIFVVDRAHVSAPDVTLRGRFHIPGDVAPAIESPHAGAWTIPDPMSLGTPGDYVDDPPLDGGMQFSWSNTTYDNDTAYLFATPVRGVDKVLRIGGPAGPGVDDWNRGVIMEDDGRILECGADEWEGELLEESITSYDSWHRELEANVVWTFDYARVNGGDACLNSDDDADCVGDEEWGASFHERMAAHPDSRVSDCCRDTGQADAWQVTCRGNQPTTGPVSVEFCHLKGLSSGWRLEYDAPAGAQNIVSSAWVLEPTTNSTATPVSSVEIADRQLVETNGAYLCYRIGGGRDTGFVGVTGPAGVFNVMDLEPGDYRVTTIATGLGGTTTEDFVVNDSGFLTFEFDGGTVDVQPIGPSLRNPDAAFAISAPAPNPAMAMVTVDLSLEEGAHVEVQVFDVAGRLVRSLVNEVRRSGSHRIAWDQRDHDGHHVGSGSYWIRTKVAGATVRSDRVVVAGR